MSDLVRFDVSAYYDAVKLNNSDPLPGMIDNASYLAFYGAQQGLWEGQHNLIKDQLGTQEAIVELEIRKEGDKITAPIAAAKVAVNEEVVKLKRKLSLAKQEVTLYTNACKAFHDRGNNARSVGTWLRTERSYTGTGGSVESDQTPVYSAEQRREVAKRLANRD